MIPSKGLCLKILKKYNVPSNIIRHCQVTAEVGKELAEKIRKFGHRVDVSLVESACLLHDVAKLLAKEKGLSHEEMGRDIVVAEGFHELAEPIRKHATHYVLSIRDKPKTLEEKIVYYADKRVMHDQVVSLKERIEDLKVRYPEHKKSIGKSEPFMFELEQELLVLAGMENFK